MALNRRGLPNSDCVYLAEAGCTIHHRRPQLCREFDCRAVFASLSRVERRQWIKTGFLSKEVFDAGRERLQAARAPR
jgi:Fe-S-cluster containining protein